MRLMVLLMSCGGIARSFAASSFYCLSAAASAAAVAGAAVAGASGVEAAVSPTAGVAASAASLPPGDCAGSAAGGAAGSATRAVWCAHPAVIMASKDTRPRAVLYPFCICPPYFCCAARGAALRDVCVICLNNSHVSRAYKVMLLTSPLKLNEAVGIFPGRASVRAGCYDAAGSKEETWFEQESCICRTRPGRIRRDESHRQHHPRCLGVRHPARGRDLRGLELRPHTGFVRPGLSGLGAVWSPREQVAGGPAPAARGHLFRRGDTRARTRLVGRARRRRLNVVHNTQTNKNHTKNNTKHRNKKDTTTTQTRERGRQVGPPLNGGVLI